MEEIAVGLKIIAKHGKMITNWKKKNDKESYIKELEKSFDELAEQYESLFEKYSDLVSNNINITSNHLYVLNLINNQEKINYDELVNILKPDIYKSIALEELIKSGLLSRSIGGRKPNPYGKSIEIPSTVEIYERLKVLKLLKDYNPNS